MATSQDYVSFDDNVELGAYTKRCLHIISRFHVYTDYLVKKIYKNTELYKMWWYNVQYTTVNVYHDTYIMWYTVCVFMCVSFSFSAPSESWNLSYV